jgi:crotonobetainyl-CoA:carnitine CoA-transferase CaiB-like acyl-CoA transferase
MANKEGVALELRDFEWENMDSSTVTQEEVTYRNELISPFLLSKTKSELFDEALKQEILLIPVNTVEDIAESPQLRAREYWRQVEHPELDDTIVYPGWPVKWTEMPAYSPQRRAPLIGEHNREVYEGELGLSSAQMVLLKTQGVI